MTENNDPKPQPVKQTWESPDLAVEGNLEEITKSAGTGVGDILGADAGFSAG